MRVLVYAAGAYALCSGTAEAFAPKSLSGLSPVSQRTAKGGRSAGAKTQLQMGLNEDPTDVLARVDALMSGKSVHSVAASFEASLAAPAAENPVYAEAETAAATPKKWEPYGGYDPASRRAKNTPPPSDAAAIMTRAAEQAAVAPPSPAR